MHSLFGTARGSNPGPFDPKSGTLTTTPPPPETTCVNLLWSLVLASVPHRTCARNRHVPWAPPQTETRSVQPFRRVTYGRTDYATETSVAIVRFSCIRYGPR